MANCLFDTSALVKYYHEESGAQRVGDLVNHPTNQIFISRLGLIEWHSAFSRLVRMGVLTSDEYLILRKRFLTDIRNRTFQVLPFERVHQNLAIRLLMKYSLNQGLRTLDALQLAVALEFHKRSTLDYFVCADVPFCQAGGAFCFES